MAAPFRVTSASKLMTKTMTAPTARLKIRPLSGTPRGDKAAMARGNRPPSPRAKAKRAFEAVETRPPPNGATTAPAKMTAISQVMPSPMPIAAKGP